MIVTVAAKSISGYVVRLHGFQSAAVLIHNSTKLNDRSILGWLHHFLRCWPVKQGLTVCGANDIPTL
jgi:hypothetical protein